MTSVLINAKSKLFAALFAIAAAIALTAAIAPASAYAADIDIYNGNTGTLIDSVDTSTIPTTGGTGSEMRGQFFKNVWNVVEGNDYITVDDFLDDYSEWDTASYVVFVTTDFPNGYNKYNNGVFTKSELTAYRNFYYTTLYDSSTSAIPTGTGDYTYQAILAFEWGSAAQTSASNAGSTNVTTSSYTYPRLIWGLESTSPASVAGNRFPSNIEAIYIY